MRSQYFFSSPSPDLAIMKNRSIAQPLIAQAIGKKTEIVVTVILTSSAWSAVAAKTVEVLSIEKQELSITPNQSLLSDMLQNAKRDIGKIDRELRAAYPRLPESERNTEQSRFENVTAAAAKPRGTTI